MFWFYMPIPKSMGRTERALAHQGFLKHTKKPDVDNLIKLYLDVVSGIVFDDDNCVSLGSAIKVYSLNPRTEIYIEETDKILTMDEVYEGTWPTMKNQTIQ